MEIQITDNLMKLLAPAFLQVTQLKEIKIAVNQRYDITTTEYGELGTAVCTWTHTCELAKLHQYLLFLAEDGGHFLTKMKAQGVLNTDKFQMSVFKFEKRRSQAFNRLFEEQAPKAGIEIIKQKSLFNG